MKTFGSLGDMALHFAETAAPVAFALHIGLDRVAERIEQTAKAEFGKYQAAHGPFPAWPELADTTKTDRVDQGYSENEPLLRSGEARDSISRDVQGLEALIGSDDKRLVYFEFGTAKMPARPVLGPAAFVNEDAIKMLVGAAVVSGLLGDQAIHTALGYDFTT